MNNKKEISSLLKYISEGDYANAKGNIQKIIDSKISDRIKTISQPQSLKK